MYQEDPTVTDLIKNIFTLKKGAKYQIVYCLDDNKHYGCSKGSSAHPIKTLELHSHDDGHACATVFSFNLGRRFLIMFDLDDVRSV